MYNPRAWILSSPLLTALPTLIVVLFLHNPLDSQTLLYQCHNFSPTLCNDLAHFMQLLSDPLNPMFYLKVHVVDFLPLASAEN